MEKWKFEPVITLGHLLQVATIIVAGLVFVLQLKGDISLLTERQTFQQLQIDEMKRRQERSEEDIKRSLGNIQSTLNDLYKRGQ